MVLVAIPVHQRGELVRRCFLSAAELELPAGSEVMTFDDASPSLDVQALIAVTHLRCRFERSEIRRGAAGMIALIWERFLASEHEWLLFLDSDMIANKDSVLVGESLAKRAGGLLSLYNSWMHEAVAVDGDLTRKSTVGNAGTFWSRKLAALAYERADRDNTIDFSYCRLFGECSATTMMSGADNHLGRWV